MRGLIDVRGRMAAAMARAGRDEGSVQLVAVSKRHSTESIREAAAHGQRHFGENYVQELVEKAEALGDLDPQWHYIGGLQRNKVKHLIGRVALLHGVDSLKLLEAIHRRSVAAGCVTPVLLQVNIDREPQKSGALPEAIPDIARQGSTLEGVSIRGLMCIPAPQPTPEAVRPAFRALRRLAEDINALALPRVSMDALSMGMSSDFEVAIEEGATLIRVGTAIFGARV